MGVLPMSIEARVHADVVFHDKGASSFTLGTLSDHVFSTPANATILTGTATTQSASIAGSGPLTTLAVKNTGTEPIRLAGAITIRAGRMAILPVTATVTVATTASSSSYSAIWVG